MSYSHPFFAHQQHRRPHHQSAGLHPQFHFYSPPTPPPHARPHHHYNFDYDYDDEPVYSGAHSPLSIDDEEAAALAHLRSIQKRKQEAKAREEAIIRAALEREREREKERYVALAIERERDRRRQQFKEEQEAQSRARKEREAAIAQAKKEREAAIIRAIEVEAKRQEEAQRYRQLVCARAKAEAAARSKAAEAHRIRAEQVRQAQAHTQSKQSQCARRCGLKPDITKTGEPDNRNELDILNDIFGSMFGFKLNDESDSRQKKDEEENKSNQEQEKVKSTVPTPVPTPSPAASSIPIVTVTPAPEATQATTPVDKSKPEEKVDDKKNDESAFPETINDLLSHFLGLRVEPEDATAQSQSPNNGVPKGLNEFLAQFGLEFEPDQVEVKENKAESSKSVSSPEEPEASTVEKSDEKVDSVPVTTPAPAPAPAPQTTPSKDSSTTATTPLTDFLNGVSDLPPFVRDILGNVELAFREEGKKADVERKERVKKDKGKAVAEGEKTNRPTPTPPAVQPAASSTSEGKPVDSITKLDSIAHELHLATSSFTFPSSLSFSTSSPTSDTPALLYNRLNKPYHAQTNKLLQLLLAADSVSSNGDKSIRTRRKELVKEVERALEELEKRRDEVWVEVKAKRDRGEESDDEGWSTSSTSSTHDHEEKHTEQEVVKDTGASLVEQPSEAGTDSKAIDAEEAKPVETEASKNNTATYAQVASVDLNSNDIVQEDHSVESSEEPEVAGYEVEPRLTTEEVEHVEDAETETQIGEGAVKQAQPEVEVVDASEENSIGTVEAVDEVKEVKHDGKEALVKDEAEEGYELL